MHRNILSYLGHGGSQRLLAEDICTFLWGNLGGDNPSNAIASILLSQQRRRGEAYRILEDCRRLVSSSWRRSIAIWASSTSISAKAGRKKSVVFHLYFPPIGPDLQRKRIQDNRADQGFTGGRIFHTGNS